MWYGYPPPEPDGQGYDDMGMWKGCLWDLPVALAMWAGILWMAGVI